MFMLISNLLIYLHMVHLEGFTVNCSLSSWELVLDVFSILGYSRVS